METRNYTALVPFRPPEGLQAWALETIQSLQRNDLVYKADWVTDPMTGLKRRIVSLWCSACGQKIQADYYAGGPICHNGYGAATAPFGFVLYTSMRDAGAPLKETAGDAEILWSGEETTCPCCGAKVRATHCGSFRYSETLGTAWPVTVGRVEDKLVLTGWYVGRDIVKTASPSSGFPRLYEPYRVKVEVLPYEAYVVEEKKLVRMKSYDKFMSSVSFNLTWKQNRKYSDEWGITQDVYPWDPALLIGSTAENSKLDLYLQSKGDRRPMTYLDCWVKTRNVENLVVQGAGELLNSVFSSCVTASYYGNKDRCTWKNAGRVDWKQKKPAKMLGLTKDEFRQLLRVEPSDKVLWLMQSLKKNRQPARSDAELQELIEYGAERARFLAEEGLPALKIVRYLEKQKQKYPREKGLIDEKHLEDYWEMSEKLGEKLDTPALLFPQHLTAEHDAVLGRMKFREQKELKAKFAELRDKLAWMAWEADGIKIRVAASESELIAEGKALSHCVGTYAKSHAAGNNCIFFIRRSDAPDTPWYTLELNVKTLTVKQNRGKRNCSETKEVIAFKEKWLEHLNGLRQMKNGARFAPKTERKAS